MAEAQPVKHSDPFKGLHTIKSHTHDGVPRIYYYYRLSKTRLLSEYGTPEFAEEYHLVTQGYKTKEGARVLAARRERPPGPTNVYFLRAATTGLIKVGRAADVRDRMYRLQTGSSEALELMGQIPDTSGGLMERAIHRRFADDRVRGEWFNPSPGLLAYIRECLAA
jgi:hypothetical protein